MARVNQISAALAKQLTAGNFQFSIFNYFAGLPTIDAQTLITQIKLPVMEKFPVE